MPDLLIFTLFATIVAIYGVLPRYRQLRVGYSLGNKRSIAFLSFFGLIIIAGYVGGLLLQPNGKESLGTISTGYTPIEITQFTVNFVELGAALVIVGVFISVFGSKSVRIRNEQFLLSILRELYNRGEYGTLVDVISDNYVPLVNHPEEPTAPGNESWFEVLSSVDIPGEEGPQGEDDDPSIPTRVIDKIEETVPGGWIERLRDKVSLKRQQARYRFKRLQYRLADTAEEATEYTESLLLDPEFSAKHPTLDPDLGIDIIGDDSLNGFRRREFTHRYLTTLLKTENSLLYRNIEDNMGGRGVYRYRIDPDNRLIYALLSDCSRVETLDVYKPVGDTAERILREQGKRDYDKYHDQRLTSSNMSDDYIFSDPIYVAIMFFDIMVSESLYQRMEWHMWLYYYDSITRLICENYELTEESDRTAEWPNDYSRLLYEITSNMVDWLEATEEMVTKEEYDVSVETPTDDEEEHEEQYADFIKLDSIDDHRGANIPKSTVICLFSCHKRILTTDEIPKQFKEYITDIIFRCCVELRKHDEGTLLWKYTELMLYCLESEINDSRSGHKYHHELQSVYDGEVRHEVVVKSMTGGDLVDELDDLIL